MPTYESPMDGTVFLRDFVMIGPEWDFFKALNAYRKTNGLVPVELLPVLQGAATWMAKDSCTRWDKGLGLNHTDSKGRDPFARMAVYGYDANAYKGEIIAAGYATGETVFEGFKASPGHDAVMRGEFYRFVGISLMLTPTGFPLWCADFGSLYEAQPTSYVVPAVQHAPAPLVTPPVVAPTA